MGRRLELNPDQARILLTRVFLLREAGIFSLRTLVAGWGISVATLYRYKSPEYRASSREHTRRAYLSYREVMKRGVCHRCEDPIEGHKRCLDCTILLHSDDERCQSCIDTRAGANMRLYQLIEREHAR